MLLFAFAILAALTLRRDQRAARRRLAWAGARSWQLALLTIVEAGLMRSPARCSGSRWDLPAARSSPSGRARRFETCSRRASSPAPDLVLVAAIALAATAVLVATIASDRRRLGRGRVAALDLAAVAAALLVVVSLRSGDDDGELVLLLPALVTFVAAVAAARLLRPAFRAAERLTRGRSLGLRFAILSLERNPGYAIAATSFLVVSFGLALFAETYRATLRAGERDAAAYAVPRDFVVQEDLRRLIPVLDAAPLGRLRALGPGTEVDPVLRATGAVGRQEGESGITLLGLPPASLAKLRGWRSDFGVDEPDALGAAIEAPDGDGGIRLGIDTRAIVIRTTGPDLRLTAQVRTVGGRFLRLELGPAGARTLRAAVPRAARVSGWLVGLELEPDTRLQERGADAGKAATGSFRLLAPALEDWIGVGGARLEGRRVDYTLTDQVVTRLRPRVPSDSRPVPVLATPRLAAAADEDGLLPLQVGGERVTVRVAQRIERVPGCGRADGRR